MTEVEIEAEVEAEAVAEAELMTEVEIEAEVEAEAEPEALPELELELEAELVPDELMDEADPEIELELAIASEAEPMPEVELETEPEFELAAEPEIEHEISAPPTTTKNRVDFIEMEISELADNIRLKMSVIETISHLLSGTGNEVLKALAQAQESEPALPLESTSAYEEKVNNIEVSISEFADNIRRDIKVMEAISNLLSGTGDK